jgi:hypothetical protein
MTCGSFVPELRQGGGADQHSAQPAALRQLLDSTRMQAASTQEKQAIDAIFGALEGVDLNAVAHSAQRR